jgi:hypothetical protein
MKYLLLILSFAPIALFAQKDSIVEEEIDFSMYENATPASNAKTYCTSKVLGLSPNKLISLSYDFQGNNSLKNHDELGLGDNHGEAEINSASGLRFAANFPVVSNTKLLVNLSATYLRTEYATSSYSKSNYFVDNLVNNGLTSTGIGATIFKPLDDKHFFLFAASADANGNYGFGSDDLADQLSKPKISIAGLYGIKRNDRSMIAFGLSRTYRPGALGYIPLILFNHTFVNRKWGIEALFPARAAVRRTFNVRNILLAGYELEGNSYSILKSGGATVAPYQNLELRRSEIRARISFEKLITGFVWFTVQAGYVVNYNFNIDDGDKLRLLGSKEAYYMENHLTNPLYFNIGIHLVSP